MKILIIRFSSIGDIVLTTPVIRVLFNSVSPIYEVHFVTKSKFTNVLYGNPYIKKIHAFESEITEITHELVAENFDHIIDLHKNIRSKRLISILRKPHSTFNKINVSKWMKVNLKIDFLPDIHIVDRYFQSIEKFHLKNDDLGLDFFVGEIEKSILNEIPFKNFNSLVVGGAHFTKQIPSTLAVKLVRGSKLPVVLVGGKTDITKAQEIVGEIADDSKIFDACGKYNLQQSAAIIEASNTIITADTGMMHIAAAFNKTIISLWGNTIPRFGMYPYFAEDPLRRNPSNKSMMFGVYLKCRPCSKIGFDKCPKGHFNCMMKQDTDSIIEAINQGSGK